MDKLTPEQEQGCLKAEIDGYVSQAMAGGGADEKQAAAQYVRAVGICTKRAHVRQTVLEKIVEQLPKAA